MTNPTVTSFFDAADNGRQAVSGFGVGGAADVLFPAGFGQQPHRRQVRAGHAEYHVVECAFHGLSQSDFLGDLRELSAHGVRKLLTHQMQTGRE